MAFKPFEKSSKDVEGKKFGKEGSRKEERFDAKQMKQAPKKAPTKRSSGRGC